ncbi:hypothetical protein M422DRAFT_32081 [Sphaerobolus stellatus SS14]|uniref:N-acetyltransferase domain-containing protein n=1 Tax=Sphaerobolus stellatus (strain SS14) TaxID=990650 RepID=A0A0C9VSF2_SPHS4|nr:hypothetical protein M422DRAFT_32081 [Sphaerobolus stellatus SS14]
MTLSIKEVHNRKSDYFRGAVRAVLEAFRETDMDSVLSLTGGKPEIFEELITAFLAMGLRDGHLDVAVINNEVVGAICWFEPGKTMKPMDDPDYVAFWEKLTPEGQKWYKDCAPLLNELEKEGFKRPDGNLERYVIESLGVKSQYRGRGIGGSLIKRCIDATNRETRTEAAIACVISSEIGIPAYRSQGMELRATKCIPSPWTKNGSERYALVYEKPSV